MKAALIGAPAVVSWALVFAAAKLGAVLAKAIGL